MTPTLPSWLLDAQIDTTRLSDGPARALAVTAGPLALDRYRRTLLMEVMGQSDWSEEAIDCLQQGQWSAAAALARWTKSVDHTVLEAEIREAWREQRRVLEQELQSKREQSRQLAAEEAALTSTLQWLAAAEGELSRLPGRNASLGDIEGLNLAALRDARDALDLAQEEIARVLEMVEQRKALHRRAIAERYAETSNLVQQILQQAVPEPALVEVVLTLQSRAAQALPSQDLDALNAVHDLLVRLHDGASPAEVTVPPPARARPSTPPAPTAPVPGPAAAAALRPTDVSSWVQGRLRSFEMAGASRPADPRERLRATLRSWDEAELMQIARAAVGGRAIQALADTAATPMLGVLLLAPAKLLLLQGELDDALSFFIDALRWALTASDQDAERAVSAAAWGVLLSFIAPFLPAEERERALRPANLAALFYRPIGRWPLERLDALGLWPDLASLLSRLDDAAGTLVSRWLAPYLRGRPVATAELAAGLLADPDGRWPAVLSVLSVLFRDVEEKADIAARIEELRGSRAPAGDARGEALDRLRHRMVAAAERSELAEAVEQATGVAMQRLSSAQASGDDTQLLGVRLITPEVELSQSERVVLELHRRDPLRAVRSLRVDVSVVDDRSRLIPRVFDGTASIPRIGPGERVEVPLRFARQDAELLRSTRIAVRVMRREPDGKLVPVATNLETFQIRVERQPDRDTKPKNPYIVGDAVKDREGIYGRDKEIEEICRALLGERQDNAVLVLGERRMGKTTVVNAVVEHPDVRGRFGDRIVRMDLQDVTPDETAAAFFRYRLIEPVQRHLTAVGIRCPEVLSLRINESPHQAFKDFMAELDDAIGARRHHALLVFDELEKLLSVTEQHKDANHSAIGPEVIAALRAAFLRSKHMGFLLAGVTDVVRRHTSQTNNRLFRLALEVPLKPLQESDARRLLEQPAERSYRIEPAARALVVQETAAHPYLLQYVGREIFEHMVKRHARVATRLDVEEVLTRLVQTKADAFQHLVDAVPDAGDARIINAMGALQRGDSTVSVAAIAAQLARTGGSVLEGDVAERLLRLRARAPMVVDDSITYTRRFRLTVGLLARRLRHVDAGRSSLVVREDER